QLRIHYGESLSPAAFLANAVGERAVGRRQLTDASSNGVACQVGGVGHGRDASVAEGQRLRCRPTTPRSLIQLWAEEDVLLSDEFDHTLVDHPVMDISPKLLK